MLRADSTVTLCINYGFSRETAMNRITCSTHYSLHLADSNRINLRCWEVVCFLEDSSLVCLVPLPASMHPHKGCECLEYIRLQEMQPCGASEQSLKRSSMHLARNT